MEPLRAADEISGENDWEYQEMWKDRMLLLIKVVRGHCGGGQEELVKSFG